MDQPAAVPETSSATVDRTGRREPWVAPRLDRLDAAATASGGFVVLDGADTAAPS